MENLAMSELQQRARDAANDPDCPTEAKIVLLAQAGVIDHYEWRLLELEKKYRYAEYNYAGAMLTEANRKVKEYGESREVSRKDK
jgi:hypothetical protein